MSIENFEELLRCKLAQEMTSSHHDNVSISGLGVFAEVMYTIAGSVAPSGDSPVPNMHGFSVDTSIPNVYTILSNLFDVYGLNYFITTNRIVDIHGDETYHKVITLVNKVRGGNEYQTF